MAEINRKKFKIFSLNANRELAQEIADRIGVPLSDCTSNRFADGEVQVNINETVRGHHCFVVQPTHAPVNENLMELLVMIDALKRASAKTINVIMPYYGYSRQDRKAKARQPITAKLVANLIEAAGATRVMTMDLHATQIQGFFDIPIDDFRAMPIIAKYFIDKKLEDIVVVSPDHGGATRARTLAEYLNAPIAIIDYAQDDSEREEGYIIGEVEGKTAILVDDILNTGKTFAEAAKILERGGVKDIFAVASHGLFAGGAAEVLNAAPIKEILVTDSVATKEKVPTNVKYISASELIANATTRIFERQPLSPLFAYTAHED